MPVSDNEPHPPCSNWLAEKLVHMRVAITVALKYGATVNVGKLSIVFARLCVVLRHALAKTAPLCDDTGDHGTQARVDRHMLPYFILSGRPRLRRVQSRPCVPCPNGIVGPYARIRTSRLVRIEELIVRWRGRWRRLGR